MIDGANSLRKGPANTEPLLLLPEGCFVLLRAWSPVVLLPPASSQNVPAPRCVDVLVTNRVSSTRFGVCLGGRGDDVRGVDTTSLGQGHPQKGPGGLPMGLLRGLRHFPPRSKLAYPQRFWDRQSLPESFKIRQAGCCTQAETTVSQGGPFGNSRRCGG